MSAPADLVPLPERHPDWRELRCWRYCGAAKSVDEDCQLWICAGCPEAEDKWHPSCAMELNVVPENDVPNFEGENDVEWWCDHCCSLWDAGHKKGLEEAAARAGRQQVVARKSSTRPQPLARPHVVNASPVVVPAKKFTCGQPLAGSCSSGKRKRQSVCCKSYVSRWLLDQHKASAHHIFTEKHPCHQCSVCASKYGTKTALKRHMDTKHPPSPGEILRPMLQGIGYVEAAPADRH